MFYAFKIIQINVPQILMEYLSTSHVDILFLDLVADDSDY